MHPAIKPSNIFTKENLALILIGLNVALIIIADAHKGVAKVPIEMLSHISKN